MRTVAASASGAALIAPGAPDQFRGFARIDIDRRRRSD
jgi:hypothetical protein